MVISLSELIVFIGNVKRGGVVRLASEILMQFVLVGEVEAAVKVVVKLSFLEFLVVAGLIDIGPDKIGRVVGYLCVFGPSNASEVGL